MNYILSAVRVSRSLALVAICLLLAAPAVAQDVSTGGWLSLGAHSASNDLFNSDPNRLNLHQGWLFVEKSAAQDDGSLGVGFRLDAMVGTDAGDTQAFGNSVDGAGNVQRWDNISPFQIGKGYGLALPQAYVEVAADNWSVKAGHFYTLIGYEVVTAPDNFFYSHAITMYNSEPFTHTGALASFGVGGGDTTIYAGYTLGWDTGFDRFGDGGSFLGGVGTTLGDRVSFTYITTAGDFGARGSSAYSHSLLFDVTLSDSLNWIIQSDYLTVDSSGEKNVGLNQYVFYTVNDEVSVGARMEWWQGDDITGYRPHGALLGAPGSQNHLAATFGANYKFAPNVTLRPELRYDWSDDLDYNQAIGGMDVVVTF